MFEKTKINEKEHAVGPFGKTINLGKSGRPILRSHYLIKQLFYIDWSGRLNWNSSASLIMSFDKKLIERYRSQPRFCVQ